MPRRSADDVDAQPPLTPRGRATLSDEKGSASLQRGSALARPIARGESYANSPLLPVVGFAFAVTACALNAWAMLPVESSIELEACTDVPTPLSSSSASVTATPSPPGQSSSSVPIPPLMSAAESAVSTSAVLSMLKGVDGGGWISPRSDLLYISKIPWASAKLAIPSTTTTTTSTTSVSEAAALAAMPPDFSGGGIVLCSGAGAPSSSSSSSTASSSQSSSSAEAPSALPNNVAVASSDNVPIYVGGRCELLTSEAGDKVSTSLFFTQSVLQDNDVVTTLVPGTTNTTAFALRSEFHGKTVCADAAAAATACAACPGCTVLALTDESVDGGSDGGTASVSPRAWFAPVAEAKLCRAHQDDRSSFLTLHEALLFVASTASIAVGAFALGHFVLFMRHTSREKITEAGNPWLLATLIVQVALVSNPFIVYLFVRFLVKAGFDGSSVNHPPQFSSFEQWLFQVFEFVAVPVGVYVFRAACMYYALDSRRLIGDEEPPAPDGSVKRWLQRWGATTFAHHGATVAYLFRSVLLLMVQWLLTDIRNPPSRELTVPSSGPYSGLNSLTPWLTGPFFSEENFAVVTFTPGSSKSDRISTVATSLVNGSVGGGGTSECVHPFASSFHDVGLPLVVIAIHVNQIVSVLARFAWPLWVGTTTMHTAIARLMAAARATGAPTVGVVSAMVYHGRALALRRLLVFVAAPVIFIDIIMAIIQAAVAPAVWERSLGASKYLMFPQSNLFTPPGLVLLGMGRCLLLWFFFAPAQDDDAAAAERKAARDTLDAENKMRTAGNQNGSNDRFSAIGPSGRLSRAQGGLRTAGSITASKPAPATSFVGPMLHFAAPIRLTRPSATPAPSAGPSRTVSIQQSAAQNGQARQDGTTRNTDALVSDGRSGDRQGDDDEGDHHHRSSATTQRPADSDGDDIAAHPDTTHDHEPAAVAAVAAVSSTANGAMVEMFQQRLNNGGVENGIDQRNGDALSRSVEDAELRAMFDPVAIASLPRLEHQLDRTRVAQQLLSERDTVEASVLRALHTACSLVDAETPATLASNDAVVLASCRVSESEFLTVFAIDGRGAGSHEEPSDLEDDDDHTADEQQRDHRPIDDDDDDEAVAQRTSQNDKRSPGSGDRTASKQIGGQTANLEERPRPAQLPLSILMVRHSHPVVGVTPAIAESGDIDAATTSVWSTHTSPSRAAATGKAAVRYSPAESTNGTRDHRQPNRAANAAEHTSIDFEGEGTQGRMDRQSGGARTSADPLQGFGLLGRPEKAREVDGKVAATARAALHTCADATAICARSTVSVRRQAKQRRAWQRQFAPLTDRNTSRSLSSATLSGGSGALGGKRSHGHSAWTSAVGEAHRALVPTAFAAAVPNSTTQAVVRRLSAHGGHALVNPLAARPEVMSASSDQQMSGFSSAGPSSPARAPIGVAMLPGSIKTPARGVEHEGHGGGVSLETPLQHDGTNHFDGDAGLETSGRSIRSVSGINDADAVQSLTGFRADALSGGTPSVCSSLSPAQASPPKFVIAPEVAVAASPKLQHVYGTVDASVSQIPSEGNRDLSRAAASARFNQSVEVPHISNGNTRGLDGGDGRAKAAPLNPSDIIQAAGTGQGGRAIETLFKSDEPITDPCAVGARGVHLFFVDFSVAGVDGTRDPLGPAATLATITAGALSRRGVRVSKVMAYDVASSAGRRQHRAVGSQVMRQLPQQQYRSATDREMEMAETTFVNNGGDADLNGPNPNGPLGTGGPRRERGGGAGSPHQWALFAFNVHLLTGAGPRPFSFLDSGTMERFFSHGEQRGAPPPAAGLFARFVGSAPTIGAKANRTTLSVGPGDVGGDDTAARAPDAGLGLRFFEVALDCPQLPLSTAASTTKQNTASTKNNTAKDMPKRNAVRSEHVGDDSDDPTAPTSAETGRKGAAAYSQPRPAVLACTNVLINPTAARLATLRTMATLLREAREETEAEAQSEEIPTTTNANTARHVDHPSGVPRATKADFMALGIGGPGGIAALAKGLGTPAGNRRYASAQTAAAIAAVAQSVVAV